MRNFNWLLFAVLIIIGAIVGLAVYFLQSTDDDSLLIVLIGIGSMLIVAGIQDLFGN